MTHLKISKGLDIPIEGKPTGEPQPFIPIGEQTFSHKPRQIGLDLSSFDDIKFKILVQLGDTVKLGQPLVEDKGTPGRFFVSPAGGTVREIRRGLKRRLLDIVIDVADKEEIEQHSLAPLDQLSKDTLIEKLKLGGLFTHIRQRPFNFLARPEKPPRSIFIKAVESAPFTPPAEMQVAGYEREFQAGINALKKLTEGQIHLVYSKNTTARVFLDAQGVTHHTVEGPHPIANSSLHIERIDPIRSVEDIIWTLNTHAVVALGFFLMHGHYFVPRVVSIAGPGIIEGMTGYFKLREGFPISGLMAGRIKKGPARIISGNPLTGHQVESEDYLGYEDTVVCAIPENTKRKLLHFFRPGGEDYTYSGAYLTGHFNNAHREYFFSTNQHGEERPFIDSSLYKDVMPMHIPTMQLVKAVMAEDYDLAAQLGLLEVDSEDFALPTFVCPSKIPMIDIIKKGLRIYASDTLR